MVEKNEEEKGDSEGSYYERAVVCMYVRVGGKHVRWYIWWEFVNVSKNGDWKCQSLGHVR